MLQQPEHVLGSLVPLPFLKMSPPSVLPCSISAWLNSSHLPPTTSYASFFRKPSLIAPIRSCLLPLIPRMPATLYLILKASELVFLFISCLRAPDVPGSSLLVPQVSVRCRLLRDPFPGSSRLGTLSWGLLTITLGHEKPRGQKGGTPSPLCPPCPEQGRAQEAGAEGIRMEQGHNRAGAVVTAGPQDAPGLHPRRYPQPQVGGGLNSADFPSFCN